jgi:hypothetical protein
MPYPINNAPLRFSALTSYDAKSPLGAGCDSTGHSIISAEELIAV